MISDGTRFAADIRLAERAAHTFVADWDSRHNACRDDLEYSSATDNILLQKTERKCIVKYQIINTYTVKTESEREKAKAEASRGVYRELLRYNESRCAADVQPLTSAPSISPIGETARTQVDSKSERKSA